MARPNRSFPVREKVASHAPAVTVNGFIAASLDAAKLAQIQSTCATALQVSRACVSSAQSNDKTASSGTVDAKLAAAAASLDRLLTVTQELNAAQAHSAKTAAALVQAVKMAENGLIDTCDILAQAQEIYQNGTAKLAAIGDEFELSPGDLDDVGYGPSESTPEADFTTVLRGARR